MLHATMFSLNLFLESSSYYFISIALASFLYFSQIY